MLSYEIYTDIGDCPVNEDSVCVPEGTAPVQCFAVADGLGGHAGGEIASRLVTDYCLTHAAQMEALTPEGLEQLFVGAQNELMAGQKANGSEKDMKTTLTVLLYDGKTAVWGHVGDTRLYHFHKGKLLSRTLDHSVPQLMVRLKEIKPEQIRFHEDRNKLLKVMGVPWDNPMYEIDCKGTKLRRGDWVLICSDGFWELIDETEMQKILSQKQPVKEALAQMVQHVRQNGAERFKDNITAILIRND